MKTQLLKIFSLGFLTALVFGSFAGATTSNNPSIKSVNPWPKDVSHGEEVYVDAEISNRASVQDAWLVVESEGERIKSGDKVDSNNDGYYVSPVAFQADGGKEYVITVKAADKDGDQISKEARIRPECNLKIIGECLY